MVARGTLDDEVAPVDAHDPADQVRRGEHLNQADYKLSLVDVGITNARADQRSYAGDEDV